MWFYKGGFLLRGFSFSTWFLLAFLVSLGPHGSMSVVFYTWFLFLVPWFYFLLVVGTDLVVASASSSSQDRRLSRCRCPHSCNTNLSWSGLQI